MKLHIILYSAHLALMVTYIVMGSRSSAPINPLLSLRSGVKTFCSTSVNVDTMWANISVAVNSVL